MFSKQHAEKWTKIVISLVIFVAEFYLIKQANANEKRRNLM